MKEVGWRHTFSAACYMVVDKKRELSSPAVDVAQHRHTAAVRICQRVAHRYARPDLTAPLSFECDTHSRV